MASYETLWGIRNKHISDADATMLIKHIETRAGLQLDDANDAEGAEEPTEAGQADGETSTSQASTRQILNRYFNALLYKPRPRPRPQPTFSLDSRPRATAPTPEMRGAPFVDIGTLEDEELMPPPGVPKDRYARRKDNLERELAERERRIQDLYQQLTEIEAELVDNDQASSDCWTDVGSQLCSEFFYQKSFFPGEKNIPFVGFSSTDRAEARSRVPRSRDFLAAWSGYLMQSPEDMGPNASDHEVYISKIPREYGTISFPTWLLIILQTCLNLAHHNRSFASFEVLDKLLTCNLFANHKPSEHLIQLAYLACAVTLDDNDKANDLVRTIVQERAPDPDAYRLFQLVNRVHRGKVYHYSTGPQQKFYARQIRAHDNAAMPKAMRDRNVNHQSFTRFNMSNWQASTDPVLPPRNPDENAPDTAFLDPQLLAAYGNMIAANNSHQVNALNYYMRAFAAQRDNPLALLSAAVAYAAMSMKRLSVNRQHQMLSAMGMLMRFREIRSQGADGKEMKDGRLKRQRWMEGEFNEGRMWHYYGLMHLAVPCYLRVLEEAEERAKRKSEDGVEKGGREGEENDEDGEKGEDNEEGVLWDEPDFSSEAALALQSIYIHSGNVEGARALGERWLVF